jgi:hypothetical protein
MKQGGRFGLSAEQKLDVIRHVNYFRVARHPPGIGATIEQLPRTGLLAHNNFLLARRELALSETLKL